MTVISGGWLLLQTVAEGLLLIKAAPGGVLLCFLGFPIALTQFLPLPHQMNVSTLSELSHCGY